MVVPGIIMCRAGNTDTAFEALKKPHTLVRTMRFSCAFVMTTTGTALQVLTITSILYKESNLFFKAFRDLHREPLYVRVFGYAKRLNSLLVPVSLTMHWQCVLLPC